MALPNRIPETYVSFIFTSVRELSIRGIPYPINIASANTLICFKNRLDK